MKQSELTALKNTILETISYPASLAVEAYPHTCLRASYENGLLKVGYRNKAQICRAISLAAQRLRQGQTRFSFEEHPRFDLCGAMLDMSRGGVMRVETVKKYIDHMAAMGLNMLMLYTEDTFELKKYPHFGYLRGRYTVEELRDIDAYADSMGLEVIPCIQTLGHMDQFLQWGESDDIRDTPGILLVGEEKTYEFIEECIGTMRLAFRSGRIHIGEDEAHDLGLGRYLQLHGYRNRLDLMKEHLARVCEICAKYDFRPMMWSDMWFRILSSTGRYTGTELAEISLPDGFARSIPDLSMVFWSYWFDSQRHYESFLSAHKLMEKELVFAGGAWTWLGYLPHTKLALDAGNAAMTACIRQGVRNAFVTLWGDNGCETNYFLAMPSLALYAQYCYKGLECTMEDVEDLLSECVGLSLGACMVMSDLHEEKERIRCLGKRFMNSDILLNVTGIEDPSMSDVFARASRKLEPYLTGNVKWRAYYAYAKLVFDIAAEKASILASLRAKYLERDMAYLEDMCLRRLPRLKGFYTELMSEHEKQWMSTYKAVGWETINARYGAQIARIDYAMKALKSFLDGRICRIEELDEPTIPNSVRYRGTKGITINIDNNF